MQPLTPQFVQFRTFDGLLLPGLFFEAENSQKVAMYLHGNGSSSVFYEDEYILAERLLSERISVLLFNNRGAHIIKSFTVLENDEEVRKNYGMAYEIIKECISDIDGAITFLQKKNYTQFFLIGHSTGANKICVYNFYKQKNIIQKYILLGGGDDTGVYYQILGKAKFQRLLAQAKKEIMQGNGNVLLTELLPEIFSYKGFYDIANPDGDYNTFPFYEALGEVKLSTMPLFRYFTKIKKPSLVIYGENDEYTSGSARDAVSILEKLRPDFRYRIIPDTDHGFTGEKETLADLCVEFLR